MSCFLEFSDWLVHLPEIAQSVEAWVALKLEGALWMLPVSTVEHLLAEWHDVAGPVQRWLSDVVAASLERANGAGHA